MWWCQVWITKCLYCRLGTFINCLLNSESLAAAAAWSVFLFDWHFSDVSSLVFSPVCLIEVKRAIPVSFVTQQLKRFIGPDEWWLARETTSFSPSLRCSLARDDVERERDLTKKMALSFRLFFISYFLSNWSWRWSEGQQRYFYFFLKFWIKF